MGIQLAEPVITAEDKAAVMDALDSGWINTTGEYVSKFERGLCAVTGVQNCVTLVNGTSALFMALKACGIGPGDKIIVPSITFAATINSIIHAGAEPIFVDSMHINIDPHEIEELMKTSYDKRIKAVMPVHIFGSPCNMRAIGRVAKKYGLLIIEDACQALGSEYNYQMCGGIGDIGVFSFSFNKIITSGNGGAVLTDNKEWAEKIRYWITQAKDDPKEYIHGDVGYNLGMTNIHAALGYSQLQRLPEIVNKKRHITRVYEENLGNIFYLPGSNCWFVGYKANDRASVRKALKYHDIQSRPLWLPNHLQKPFSHFQRFSSENGMSEAEKAHKEILNLPCGINITDEDIIHICEIIRKEDE